MLFNIFCVFSEIVVNLDLVHVSALHDSLMCLPLGSLGTEAGKLLSLAFLELELLEKDFQSIGFECHICSYCNV